MRLVTSALIILLGASIAGCAPVNAASAIADGTDFVEQAKREGAKKYARYEFHKAIAYLDEAKLKNGYGEYGIARRYALTAAELAVEAKKSAIRRRDLELRRLKGKQLLKERSKRRALRRSKRSKAKRPLKAPRKRLPIRPPILPPNMQPPKPPPTGADK